MKAKLLYLTDQLAFSAVNFVGFILVDYRYQPADSNAFSVMLSAAALLFNIGFAVRIEPLLVRVDKRIDQLDLVMIILLSIVLSGVWAAAFWSSEQNQFLLSAALASSGLLWTLRKACILEETRVQLSIAITCTWGACAGILALTISDFKLFLASYSFANFAFSVAIALVCVHRSRPAIAVKWREIKQDGRLLISSLFMAPLLWFPSNGIYPLASLKGGIDIAEIRKILMLLSPTQQGAGALASYLFSRRGGAGIRPGKLLLLCAMAAAANTMAAALVYDWISIKSPLAQPWLVWCTFAVIAAFMVSITSLQSILRLRGEQTAVLGMLIAGSVTLTISYLVPLAKLSPLAHALGAMAAGYAVILIVSFLAYMKGQTK